jgi:hypothetical protein
MTRVCCQVVTWADPAAEPIDRCPAALSGGPVENRSQMGRVRPYLRALAAPSSRSSSSMAAEAAHDGAVRGACLYVAPLGRDHPCRERE